MNVYTKLVLILSCAIISAASMIALFVQWFKNPEFTAMQMMIEYWPLYVIMVSFILLLNIIKYIEPKR